MSLQETPRPVIERKSCFFVIDACVLCSAGGEEATHPESKNCRNFLQNILEIGHKAALSDELRAEWDRHPSKFSILWRSEMTSRKRIHRISETAGKEDYKFTKLNEKTRRYFQNRMKSAKLQDKKNTIDNEKIDLLKDWHLFVAALSTDRLLASKERRLRDIIESVAQQVGEFRQIAWVNPTEKPEKIADWLADGAPVDRWEKIGDSCH